MICVDANVFLRALVEPTTARGRQDQAAAQHFFEAIYQGQSTYTATVVAIHEALYALTGRPTRNGYGLSPAEACTRMRRFLELPGFHQRDKQAILNAMSLWIEHPGLGFSDAFTATIAAEQRLALLTFDADFDDLSDLDRYRPAA